MNPQSPAPAAVSDLRSIPWLPPRATLAFAVAVMAVISIAGMSFSALQARSASREAIARTMTTLESLQRAISAVKDAETGQRGFLLTGEEPYLAPHSQATAQIPGEIQGLRNLMKGNEAQTRRVDKLENLIQQKLDELERTIALRRDKGIEAALAAVYSDRGKEVMDDIRTLVTQMEAAERAELATRQDEWTGAATLSSLVTWGGSGLLLALILIGAVFASRDYRTREKEIWLKAGQMGLAMRLQGEQRLDQLGESLLSFLGQFLSAQVGAVYMPDHGRLRRFAGYALPGDDSTAELRATEGLVGQAVREQRTLLVREVPPGYLPVSSSLGRADSTTLLIAPAVVDGKTQAVIELGFFRPLLPEEQELMDRVSEMLAVAVRTSRDRTRLEELLEETQRQSEELQSQQEELRVSNEELEEQSRALRESAVRLESQQTELEQTNSQLEEQTQMLAAQRDELERAQTSLEHKARDLERSNQYKSEFLANMSHELRTPLNSSLILAKLLADNKQGNLSEEQVRFAQTISSAGNDLLALINDILDLSKIEAGKVEVLVESMPVARTLESLAAGFEPVARQNGLDFGIHVEPGTPEFIDTDPQRLGQILRNLLSNALKFTEKGRVSVTTRSLPGQRISFTVRDSGIGIPEAQQGIIFEAFRQADGSTHRKYGGTGLGLSISRDLARLLGGDITVESTPGQGSAFTVELPLKAPAPGTVELPRPTPSPMPVPLPAAPTRAEMPPAAPLPSAGFADDRASLVKDARLVLAIEDDQRFAAILRDLAHEIGFQCIVAVSASEGLAAAAHYRPDAILLDMNLPDHSGLGVLDQLKHNSQTRHIPVHVVSVADYAQEALELGAIGYALKPVKRELLVEAFRRLEQKASQVLRRVLVVEDDERQRESIGQLLGDSEAQIVGVGSAAEALDQLQSSTFDCMVMDLSLPDFSGYELLERMAAQEELAFPPVIVYTGRSLTRDEEQKLRRFSRSIIVKDARSPERLLDEVTLFIHQVESRLPPERQRMLQVARDRELVLEGKRILVVEDDVRNIFALSSVLEPKGAKVEIARNGREALESLRRSYGQPGSTIDLVLMDIMMPEMDGFTAMREIRRNPDWKRLPIIALTAKAMKDDQEKCLAAGANDYIAKPLDVEKLLSLVRVWMPK
ncbi:response regulator [Solimonas sp. SE-A11]|uniref:response regulator n=1 Tax=Solimonas sp. SE-A11 TaxID=3054954 RepID=UPI00259CF046|nr:response regulator [Solimonas sp. SE-A11]MDM4769497.1 response regulator [Solimonas sp. SE-A11]